MGNKRSKAVEEIKRSRIDNECDLCGGMILKGDKIRVKTTKYSWFRGDDYVEISHEICPKKEE